MTRTTLPLDGPLADYWLSISREPAAMIQLRTATQDHRLGKMQLAPEQGLLLMFLLRLIGAQRYLEVGTFTGYSALAAALAMGETGRVTACDVSDTFTRVAREHWQAAGVAERIALILQPALRTMDDLLAHGAAGSYDCVFVDADKPPYPEYYERALQLLRPGGLVILDNMLQGGSVATAQDDEAPGIRIVRELNEQLRDDERVEHCMLPLGDGMTLLRKR
ncbi:Predicted O-methyltransferase YrrM [Andreprevotia lacus DSM 23236]|jgi:predicted O-methyltransferase YrrM|uniref:Predicted O-methyltransferase YrrM n=1 Tax=Andreprevotia lacus DSM 23236 TaxID=1121001 RepID=A0A1W1Y191_9NEIS|nr:class I SAM-dependent methyltransferase [Andreprevotia lacus]SMC29916.1 Predicted O-methyltransferase YrrM [Andreprevotia lacus DSM 23236]